MTTAVLAMALGLLVVALVIAALWLGRPDRSTRNSRPAPSPPAARHGYDVDLAHLLNDPTQVLPWQERVARIGSMQRHPSARTVDVELAAAVDDALAPVDVDPFPAADLRPYLAAVDEAVRDLAEDVPTELLPRIPAEGHDRTVYLPRILDVSTLSDPDVALRYYPPVIDNGTDPGTRP